MKTNLNVFTMTLILISVLFIGISVAGCNKTLLPTDTEEGTGLGTQVESESLVVGQDYNCTPSWHLKIPTEERFVLVLDDAAVLDSETCLVWERSPDNTLFDWYGANRDCVRNHTGGRFGWHLPTVHQLTTLVEIDYTTDNFLPQGHPFIPHYNHITSSFGGTTQTYRWLDYWTASTVQSQFGTSSAYRVHFSYIATYIDTTTYVVSVATKKAKFMTWCVRNGQTYDSTYEVLP